VEDRVEPEGATRQPTVYAHDCAAHDVAVSRDERHGTRDHTTLDLLTDGGVDTIQPSGRKSDILRGGSND
jgi:hypothetical protein